MPDFMQNDDESRQLLSDLLVLSSVPHELISAISTELKGKAPFVSLDKLVAKHVAVPEANSAVARLIANLDVESVPVVTEMVQAWRESLEDENPLNDDGFELLKQNLESLIQPATAGVIGRTQKAAALMTATGNEVTGLSFICDARPVYNDARTEIEGYIPLATMKIYFERPNDESDAIEFVLTPGELDAVIERATQARAKINLMQKTFSAWIPNGTGENMS